MEYQKISESVSEPFSENLKKLQELFPSVVKDGEVDFDALRAELGEFTEIGKERYELTWAGKQDAQLLTGEPLVGKTLKYVAEESKNPETTVILYIEGDNLVALKLLQNSYRGKIKMIYIDPPYNTGVDLIYQDRRSQTQAESDIAEGARTEDGKRLIINPDTSARYHANWLSMIYPRMRLARDFLQDDGVIFISIDDYEVANMRRICDEIFGEKNLIVQFTIVSNSSKNNSNQVSVTHDYVLCYVKNKSSIPSDWLVERNNIDEFKMRANMLLKRGLPSDEIHKELLELIKYPRFFDFDHYTYVDKRGPFRASDLTAPGSKAFYDVLHPITQKPCKVGRRGWAYSPNSMNELIHDDRIYFGSDESVMPQLKNYLFENEKTLPRSVVFFDSQASTKWMKNQNLVFSYPKAIDLLKYLISMYPADDYVVMDFFSGSSSTAHAVMQLNAEDKGNRKFIMVQIPEVCEENSDAYKAGYKNICEIGKERIRRAGEKIKAEHPEVDVGFKVFKVDDTNIRWLAAEAGKQGITLEDALSAGGKDLRDFMNGTNDLDVVYEILIRQYGIPLTAPIDLLSDIGERTYSIADTVVVCLEEEVTDSVIDKIANLEPIPQKIVFRDSAFGDDISLKENAMLRLDALMQKHAVGGRQPYSIEFL
ncbi:site-specific DNA-methyltransferase [Methanocorpusculum sp.]|nr:site-specific DNA-methyltransferase [Methanocorpusculum sp.]